MTTHDDITICITMGHRPDHLKRSLESLGPELRALPTIAINDFGDQPTNDMFFDVCPHGELVDLGGHVGHTRAIDAMYERVQSKYIFHMEDDWEFYRQDFIGDAIAILDTSKEVSSVCFRDMSDIKMKGERRALVQYESIAGVNIARADGTHDNWFGYTFNPNLALTSHWQTLGGFSQFRGEMPVSRAFRRKGMFTANLEPGACRHIGWGDSIRKQKQKGQIAT